MKYIELNKLKVFIVDKCNPINKYELLQLLDELSEERESIPTLEAINKTRGKDYTNGGLVNKNNPLKVAIKADGTEEYGKKIIEYFKKLAGVNYWNLKATDKNVYYFVNDINRITVGGDTPPKNYTEISLKEEGKEEDLRTLQVKLKDTLNEYFDETDDFRRNAIIKVKELEKELTELKLKLKDLIK